MHNGIYGAVAGLIVAGIMQLLLPFVSPVHNVSQPSWLATFDRFLVDPNFRVVDTAVPQSHLLMLLNEILNASAIWVVAGFLFGYVFHAIRGHDGFIKAAVFGGAVLIPYVLSRVLLADDQRLFLASLLNVVPLLIFLLGLGVLVFDGTVLRKQGVDLVKLPTIYGLRTSIGYLSFASGLAAIEPLLEFLKWLLQ